MRRAREAVATPFAEAASAGLDGLCAKEAVSVGLRARHYVYAEWRDGQVLPPTAELPSSGVEDCTLHIGGGGC